MLHPSDAGASVKTVCGADLLEQLKAAVLCDAGWSSQRGVLCETAKASSFLAALASAIDQIATGRATQILCACIEDAAGGMLALRNLADAEREGDHVYGLLSLGELSHLGDCAVAEVLGDGSEHYVSEQLRPWFEESGLRELPRCRLAETPPEADVPQFQALVRALLAVHLKTIPPGRVRAGSTPRDCGPFYGTSASIPWIHGKTGGRRAAILDVASGQPRVAVVVHEYAGTNPQHGTALQCWRPSELFLASADSGDQLAARLKEALVQFHSAQAPDFARLCYRYSVEPARGSFRFAAVAHSAADLAGKIQAALATAGTRDRSISERSGTYCVQGGQIEGKTVFLFPGFNSEYPGMLADLCTFFPGTREWFDSLDRHANSEARVRPSELVYPPPEGITAEHREKLLWDLKLGGPAGLVADLALMDLTRRLGISCDAVAGHSNGENAALIAANIFRYREKDAICGMIAQVTRHYREGKQHHRNVTGHFLLVSGLNAEEIDKLLAMHGGHSCLAMENCANQVVLYAPGEEGPALSAQIQAAGGVCILRPTERPYHTHWFSDHLHVLQQVYRNAAIGAGTIPAYSTITASPFPPDPDGIRELAARQWTEPVQFRRTIQRLYDEGFRFFIEIGPDATVSAFVKDILRGNVHATIPANVRSRSGLEQLQHLAARLFVEGKPISPQMFFEDRDLEEPVRAPATPVKEQHLNQSPLLATAAQPSQPLPSDPFRDYLLASHFDLMNRFLDSQAAVLSSALARLGSESDTLPATFANPSSLQSPGEVPPVAPQPAAAPARRKASPRSWRLTGEVVERTERRLYTERRFTVEEDTFLLHHALGRKISVTHPELIPLPIVPFTISMSILAEAACRLLEGKHCIALAEIRGYRWLAADRGAFTLGIESELIAESSTVSQVRVRLFEHDTNAGKRYLAYEGIAHLSDEYPARPHPLPVASEGLREAQVPTEFFYSYCTYNGPTFQGIREVLQFDSGAILAQLQVPPLGRFRGDAADPELEIPGTLLDCTGQLSGYWLVEQGIRDFGIFPFHTARYSQFAPSPASGVKLRTNCTIRRDAHIVTCSFDFLEENGRVFARLEDMQLRFYDNPWVRRFFVAHDPGDMFSSPLDTHAGGLPGRRVDNLSFEFLNQSWGIWARALAHLTLNASELDFWYGLSQDPRRLSWLLGRLAAKDAVRAWANSELGLELCPPDIEIAEPRGGTAAVLCPLLSRMRPIPRVSIRTSGETAFAALHSTPDAIGIELSYDAPPGVELNIAYEAHCAGD